MANKLDKEILVGDESYQVTAVHSDTADQVVHKLTIETSEGTKIEFDGSEEQSISVVEKSGGTFSGPIKIDTTESINEDNDVPTIKHVNDIVAALTGAPLLSWENGTLEPIKANATDILPIKVVYGTEVGYQTFCAYLKNKEDKKGHYLYLAIQDPHITAYLINAEDITNISSFSIGSHKIVSEGTSAYFDYSDIDSGFKSLHGAIAQIFDSSDIADGTSKGLKQLDDEINVLEQNINERIALIWGDPNNYNNGIIGLHQWITDIVRGVVSVAKADRASSADSATKASQDSNGNTIHTNYYKSNSNTTEVNSIYIKTSDPTTATGSDATLANNAKVGDIWIVYKTN